MVERKSIRDFASLLFALGLAFLLLVVCHQFVFGDIPMRAGQVVLAHAEANTGAANIVTSVVLAYRGIDTLGEIGILFSAATAAGLVLGKRRKHAQQDADAGFILTAGADLMFPLLLIVGFYIILHGHLTPGGGFQGGVILAAAFYLPLLARPGTAVNHTGLSLIEGLSGAVFIGIGLMALYSGKAFLEPIIWGGETGNLLSAGTLPVLYLAIGLKVGAELAGLLANLAAVEADDA